MKTITKRIISTLAICGALVLEAGATAIGSLGKALNNIAKVDAATDITIASADVVTNSSYAKYETTVSDRKWLITFGGNNKSVGTNSGNRSKCNLSSYSKYAVSPVSTSDVATAFAGETKLDNIGEISYTFNGGSNQGNTNVYIIYSSDGNSFSQLSLTSGTQGATISSGTSFKFNSCSGFFALLFKATNSSGNWRIDDVNITFKAVAASKYTVAFNSNGGEGSMDGIGQDSASYTLPSCTFTAPNGKAFDKWALESTSGTQYSAGSNVTLSEGTNTFYALWKDVEYTDIPAGDYSVTFNANTDTAVPNGNYAIKTDGDGKYYKPLVVKSTNATLNTSYHEFTYTKSTGKLEVSTASNAKITEVHIGYYKDENGTLKVNGTAASKSTTDVVVPFVGSDNKNYKYTINSESFSYEAGSSYAGNIFSMVIHLKVEAASGPTDVINEIDALPTAAYTQEFADKLNSALEHYNKLSASDQALVTNHNKLLTAQSSFNELRDAAVANVESLITQIGTVTADSGAKISTARNAYDALLADTLGKSLVSNYSTLTAAEATYQDAQAVKAVEDLINALPDAADIDDYSHHGDIAAARAAYEALSSTQKSMVSAASVSKLEACENAEKPFAPKEATFHYGGTTTGSFVKDTNAAKTILNADDSQWSVIGYADKANIPGYNKDGTFRLYYNASGSSYFIIKILIADAKITNMTLNFNASSPTTNVVVTDSKGSIISGSSNVYTINDTEVKIKNGASSNLQVWFDSIVCSYSIPISSTITYNGLEGVDNSNNPTSYVEGTGCTIAAPKGTREGYTFIGWFDNPSYSGSAVTSISAGKTGNITLYAKWQINSHTYKIVYDNGTADATDTLNYGTTITIPAAPSKTGYEFLNWSDGTNTYNPGATVSMPDKDFTITAKYNVAKYTITFYKAVGEVFTTYSNKEYLSEIDLPSPAPTKEGYTFIGWAEDSSATEASWATGKYQVPAKNVDFYAVFTDAPAITGVTLANTFTSIELTEANNSFSATAEVSITPHSLDTTIDWSVSPTDAGTLTNTSTNSGVSPIFTASKLYDEVTITATSHEDDNYYKSFTFAIVNPADEYVSDIVINEGASVKKSYYSSETAVDMTGLTADATYKSTARPLYEDTRDVTESATWTLDIANKKVIASLGGKTDYIAIEVIEDAITEISVDDNTGKREYTIGESFDSSGVTVTGSYNNPAKSDTDVTSDCVFDDSAFDSLHEGTYTINVSYKGSETIVDSYTVEVKKATVSETGWKLVTSNADLSAGSKYLIVGIKQSNYYGIQAYSSGNNIKGSIVNSPDEDNFIQYDSTKGNAEITLGGSVGNWTLFDGSLYLYAAGGTGKNNYLKGVENADNANAQWSIDVATDGKATIKTADTTVARHTMRFNTNGSDDPLFSCYASGQSDIYLYKYVAGSSAKIVGVDATYTGEITEGTVINNTDSTITFNTITNTGVSTEIEDPENVTLNGGNSATLAAGLNEIELSYTIGDDIYTGTLKINATAVTKYDLSVTINDDQAEYTVSPTITDNKLIGGKDYTVEITAKEGYTIDLVTASGATVSGSKVTITNTSSDVSITVTSRALETFNVTYDGTNAEYATISPKPSSIVEGNSLELTVTANEHKKIDSVVVMMGLSDVTDTAWDESTGEIYIEEPNDDINITVNCSYITHNVSLSYDESKICASSTDDKANQGLSYVNGFTFDEIKYEIDRDLTEITMENQGAALIDLTDKGVLTISEVTGDISVSIVLKDKKYPVATDDSVVGYTINPGEVDALGNATINIELKDHYNFADITTISAIVTDSGLTPYVKNYTLEGNSTDGYKITIPQEDIFGSIVLTTDANHDDCNLDATKVGVNGAVIVNPKTYNTAVDYTFVVKEGFDASTLHVAMTCYDEEFTNFELTNVNGTYHVKFTIIGDTVITIDAKAIVSNNFTPADMITNSNTDTTAIAGGFYTGTLTFIEGYDPANTTVKVEMRDDLGEFQDITNSVYSADTGVIYIETVAGEIKITAETALKLFDVTFDGDTTHYTPSIIPADIAYGSPCGTTISPNTGYKLTAVSYVMGEADPVSVTIGEDGKADIDIEKVTGDIVITVTTEALPMDVKVNGDASADKETVTFDAENVEITVTADTGYHINSLSYTNNNGEPVDVVATYPASEVTFTIPKVEGEIVITAVTEINHYTVTINGENVLDDDYVDIVANVGGSVVDISSGSIVVEHGEYVQIIVEPNSGKKFVEGYPIYTMGGSTDGLVWDDNRLTIDPITGDVVFTANIEKIQVSTSLVYDVYVTNATTPDHVYEGETTIYEFKFKDEYLKTYEFDRDNSYVKTYVDGEFIDLIDDDSVWYYDSSSYILSIIVSNPNTMLSIHLEKQYIEYSVVAPVDAKFYSLDVPETIHFGDENVEISVVADEHCQVNGVKVYLDDVELVAGYTYSNGVVTIASIEGNYRIEADATHDNVTIALDATSSNIDFTVDNPKASYEYESVITGYFSVVAPYKLPSLIKIFEYGTEIGNDKYSYNSTTGVFSIEAKGDIVIIAKGSLGKVTVKLADGSSEYASLSPAPEVEYDEGASFSSTLVVDTGYQIASVVVMMGNEEVAKAFNAYDNSIYIHNLTGDVEITVVTEDATFGVTVNTSNAIKVSGDATATYGTDYEASFEANTGYKLDASMVSVTMGGNAKEFTLDDSGNLVVENVTDVLVINVVGKAIPQAIDYSDAPVDYSNKPEYVAYNDPFETTINIHSGYEYDDVDGIIVMMDGVDVTDSVLDVNKIEIEHVTGEVQIIINYHTMEYLIDTNLTNVTIDNEETSINHGESFVATLTADEGYHLVDVYVEIAGVDVTDAVYHSGVININAISGDLYIEASAEINTYSIANLVIGGHWSTDNTNESINHGVSYEATISASEGYEIVSINVTMDGRPVDVFGNEISIVEVTGDLKISVETKVISFNIDYYLDNVDLTNVDESVEYFDTYTSEIIYDDDGYKTPVVHIYLNGEDVTDSFYDDVTKTITITKVIGDVEIIISAEANEYVISYSLTNAISNNNETVIHYGDSFDAVINALAGYENLSVEATMGDEISYDNIIHYDFVTGDIEIVAKADPILQTVSYYLENASASSYDSSVEYNGYFKVSIESNYGYENLLVIVMMGEDFIEPVVLDDIVIVEIEHVTGPIEICAYTDPIKQSIAYEIDEHASIDNDIEEVDYNDMYSALVSVDEGYTCSIEVYMDDVNVTSSVVNGYDIDIDRVSGNIRIIVVVSPIPQNIVADTGDNAILNKDIKSINYNEELDVNVIAMNGYEISSIKVTMNGEEVIDAVSDNRIYIEHVIGEVEIVVLTNPIPQPVETDSRNAAVNYESSSINYGERFEASVSINKEEFQNLTVKVYMDDIDVTNKVYDARTGKILIEKVTGKVVIEAKANPIPQKPEEQPKEVEETFVKTVEKGKTYKVELETEEGREVKSIVVRVGDKVLEEGKDYTIDDEGNVNITNIEQSGELEIVKKTVAKTYTVSFEYNHANGSNPATSASHGTMYLNVITAEEGYTLKTVTVFMNNQDVSKSVYNYGAIGIQEVSGDIVIRVTTEKVEAKLVSIIATTEKTEIEYGGTFTADDVVVIGTYDNGDTKILPCTISGFDSHKAGKQEIKVYAGGLESKVIVTVKAEVKIVGIEASTEKTTIPYGGTFTKDDVVASYVYSDGTKQAASVDKIEGFNALKAGEQTITVTVGEFTTSIKITVLPEGKVVTSIEVSGYTDSVDQGKEYVFDGKVIAHYSDNTSEEVDGYSVSKVDTTEPGAKEVRVTYADVTVRITINVIQTLTPIEPAGYVAIAGGALVGISAIAVGIYFFLKMFKL